MIKQTFDFVKASADVSVSDNLIYIHVSGIFTDEVALRLIQYIEELMVQIPDNPIRVWDSNGIPSGSFQLSSQCIDQIAVWAKKLKAEKPDSVAYMVGESAVSYGMARMYGIKSGLEETGVIALRSMDELPSAIKETLRRCGSRNESIY
jgi:hypothetical protein